MNMKKNERKLLVVADLVELGTAGVAVELTAEQAVELGADPLQDQGLSEDDAVEANGDPAREDAELAQ